MNLFVCPTNCKASLSWKFNLRKQNASCLQVLENSHEYDICQQIWDVCFLKRDSLLKKQGLCPLTLLEHFPAFTCASLLLLVMCLVVKNVFRASSWCWVSDTLICTKTFDPILATFSTISANMTTKKSKPIEALVVYSTKEFCKQSISCNLLHTIFYLMLTEMIFVFELSPSSIVNPGNNFLAKL